MSATSWQHGPSYTPFSHTNNSTYGAFLAGPSPFPVSSTHNEPLKQLQRGTSSILPSSSPTRIRAVDVSKIAASTGRTSEVRAERSFSDPLARYGTSTRVPSAPHYGYKPSMDSVELRTVPPRSAGSLLESSSRDIPRYTPASGYSVNNVEDSSSKFGESLKFNTLPNRSRYLPDDPGLHRSHTTLGTTPRDHHLTLHNETQEPKPAPHSYQSYSQTSSSVLDITPGFTRSNTFHGNTSANLNNNYSTQNGLSAYNSKNYIDQHIGDESKFSEHGSSLVDTQGLQHKYSSRPFTDITQEHNISPRLAQEPYVPKPPAVSREVERRPWLGGSVARSPQTTSAHQSRPLTPYRPGDYLLRYDPTDATLRKYNPPSDIVTSTGSGGADVLEPHKDKNRYNSSLVPSYLASELTTLSNTENVSATNAYGSGYSQVTANIINTLASRKAQKSILKKGSGYRSASLDHARSFYGHNDFPSLGGRAMYAQSAHPLPPLCASDAASALRKTSSGKRVTFNLALNQSRPILDCY